MQLHVYTLPETNIAPENRPSQKEMSSSNHQFSDAMLVSGSVAIGISFASISTIPTKSDASKLTGQAHQLWYVYHLYVHASWNPHGPVFWALKR